MLLAKSAKTNIFYKSNFKKLLVFALFANIIASPNLLYEDYIKSAEKSQEIELSDKKLKVWIWALGCKNV